LNAGLHFSASGKGNWMHCFTYGTLMTQEIMDHVAGCTIPGVPAWLADYARYQVRGEDYPGLLPCPGKVLSGVLYRDLPDDAWHRLDAFEGEMYYRAEVRVRLADDTEQEALTYMFKPGWRALLLPEEWDPEHFREEGRLRFMQRYLGFTRLQQG